MNAPAILEKLYNCVACSLHQGFDLDLVRSDSSPASRGPNKKDRQGGARPAGKNVQYQGFEIGRDRVHYD